MRAERSRDGVGLLLLLRLETLEELHHRRRIVAGLVQVLHAEEVGVLLELAGELQHRHRQGEVGCLLDAVTGPTSEEHQRNAGVPHELRAGRAPRAVPGCDMGDLVRHHARQLRLVLGQLDEAGVDVEVTAGQRERVHLVGIDHLDCEWHPSVRVANEVLPDPVDVLGDDRVVDDLGVLLDLGRELPAELDFLLEAVEVDGLADAALADLRDIFLGVFRLALGGVLGQAQFRLGDADCQDRRCRKNSGNSANHVGPLSSLD